MQHFNEKSLSTIVNYKIYLGKNLLYLRKLRKLQQSEMPENIGISRATWSDYENGRTEPNLETVVKISEFFGISLDTLIITDIEAEVIKGNLIKNEETQKITLKGNLIGNKFGNLKEQNNELSIVSEHQHLSKYSSLQDVIDAVLLLQLDFKKISNKSKS
ncbi:MAG: helix-turn-helix transcriptional regulator [Bacteroidetes bacterium]|nr:helix-turn-helix transcriptional regulator [Bacteroidota bacterium]